MTPEKKYRHVFFDLDETLWDFKRNSLETLHDLINFHQLDQRGIERTFFIERYYYHNDFYWGLFRKGKITREELRTIRWRNTLREFNIHDEVLTVTISEQYLHILPTKKNLLEDAIEVLSYLKQKYLLHVITNGFEEVQMRKIEAAAISNFFTHIITSERAGYQKPSREIFQYALDISNAEVSESIFIGDSIEADIQGAKIIGMDHVLFNPEKIKHGEIVDREIDSLAAIREFL